MIIMRKFLDFQKPYISPIDLKPKFKPTISLVGCNLEEYELDDLKMQIDDVISEISRIKFVFDYAEESEVVRLVEEYR